MGGGVGGEGGYIIKGESIVILFTFNSQSNSFFLHGAEEKLCFSPNSPTISESTVTPFSLPFSKQPIAG